MWPSCPYRAYKPLSFQTLRNPQLRLFTCLVLWQTHQYLLTEDTLMTLYICYLDLLLFDEFFRDIRQRPFISMYNGHSYKYHTWLRTEVFEVAKLQKHPIKRAHTVKHTAAHSTKPSFMPKTNNQTPKKFSSLALSWAKVVKNWTSF